MKKDRKIIKRIFAFSMSFIVLAFTFVCISSATEEPIISGAWEWTDEVYDYAVDSGTWNGRYEMNFTSNGKTCTAIIIEGGAMLYEVFQNGATSQILVTVGLFEDEQYNLDGSLKYMYFGTASQRIDEDIYFLITRFANEVSVEESAYDYVFSSVPIEWSLKCDDTMYLTLWKQIDGVKYYYNTFVPSDGYYHIYQYGDWEYNEQISDTNNDGFNDLIIYYNMMTPMDYMEYDAYFGKSFNYVIVNITFYGNEGYEFKLNDIEFYRAERYDEDQTLDYISGFKVNIPYEKYAECTANMQVYLHNMNESTTFIGKYTKDIFVSINYKGDWGVRAYEIAEINRNLNVSPQEAICFGLWNDDRISGIRTYYSFLCDTISYRDCYQNGIEFNSVSLDDMSQSGDEKNDLVCRYVIDLNFSEFDPYTKYEYDYVYVNIWFHNYTDVGMTIDDFRTDVISTNFGDKYVLSFMKECEFDYTIEYVFMNDSGVGSRLSFNGNIVVENYNGYIDNPDYNKGYHDALTIYNFIGAVLKAPVTFINEALSFDVFGVNVLNFVRVIIAAVVAYIVIRLIIKVVN